jgi:protein Tex
VDKPRKRIALTLRLDDEVGSQQNPGRGQAPSAVERPRAPAPRRTEPEPNGALADALRRAGITARGTKP